MDIVNTSIVNINNALTDNYILVKQEEIVKALKEDNNLRI